MGEDMFNLGSIGIMAGVLTLIITFFGYFNLFKAELRKNTEQFTQSRLMEEKRHGSHEQRLAIVEERMAFTDNIIAFRLNEISDRLSEISTRFEEHLRSE
jgi:hypothetical protein